MNNAAFLLIVVVVSGIGSLYVWLRTRKPQAFMNSIEEFQKEMAALARDPEQEPPKVRRPTKLKPIVVTRSQGSLADKLRAARRMRGDDAFGGRGGSAYQTERQIDVDGVE